MTSHDTFSHHKSLKFGQIAHKRLRVECGRSRTFNIRRTKVSFLRGTVEFLVNNSMPRQEGGRSPPRSLRCIRTSRAVSTVRCDIKHAAAGKTAELKPFSRAIDMKTTSVCVETSTVMFQTKKKIGCSQRSRRPAAFQLHCNL